MYFSNISDEEMDKYHQQIYAPNFTIKLTDMADSGLFKIEELTNTILKVYPLFYTKIITSSNPNDQILENRCIICENNNKTRVTFISDENAEIEDYIQYGAYKEIGDTLTDAEWNSMVQLIRNNHILTSNIKIKNGSVVDDYGEYVFDINSSTIVDNGILITNETLENLGTVTLINPAFHYATYTLTLTVLSVDEINILDPSDSETETTTITLELIENEPVQIPFETLNKYCIILFNATISITQNKPIIKGTYITDLQLTADKPIIQTQETSILEITATDLEHLPMPNKSIQLLKNNVLLDTLTTDSQGKCTYNYQGTGAGKQDFIAKYRGLQSETYEVYDTITYDTATASDYNDIWELTNATLVRENEYSRLSETNVGTNAYIYAGFPNVKIIEFDVLQEDGISADALFSFYQNITGKSTFQLKHLGDEVELNTWYRVKCIVEENKVTIINKDTEYQTIREFTGVINRGRFATSGTTTALQFRNFKAY